MDRTAPAAFPSREGGRILFQEDAAMTMQKDPWEDRQPSLFSLTDADNGGGEEVQVYESEEEALDEIMDRRSETDGSEAENGGPVSWPDHPDAPQDGKPSDGETTVSPALTAAAPDSPKKKTASSLSLRVLRRAALAFLASKQPDGLAAGVYVSALHAPVDAVSFSLSGASLAETRLALASLTPARLAMSPEKRERLARLIGEQESLKTSLEETIRQTEPHLNASLFPETGEWDYEKSANARYHRCLRKLEKLRYEQQYSGKLERLLADKTADELFLILPEGTDYSSVPQEWGIVLLTPALTLNEVRPASKNGSEEEKRAVLATAAAVAARENVLFANGIRLQSGTPVLTRVPRRRPSAK